MPPKVRPHHVYTDNAGELTKVFEEKGWANDTSVPHRPETNGQAEAAVKKVKEGTSSLMHQSGFLEPWWESAMTCYCFLRNVYDKLENHKTPYEMRFGEPFLGPMMKVILRLFLGLLPHTVKMKARCAKTGKKLFVKGHALIEPTASSIIYGSRLVRCLL